MRGRRVDDETGGRDRRADLGLRGERLVEPDARERFGQRDMDFANAIASSAMATWTAMASVFMAGMTSVAVCIVVQGN
jgi:hypothetical protein